MKNTYSISPLQVAGFQPEFTRRWVRSSKIGYKKALTLDSDNYGYTYHIQEAVMNTDPFVRKSLKRWDYGFYKNFNGWTKTVRLADGLKDLVLYDEIPTSFEEIRKDPHALSHWKEAIKDTTRIFTPREGRKLNMLRIQDAVHMLAEGTSAGFTFPEKKKVEVVEETFKVARYMMHRLKYGMCIYDTPCKLAFRGHLSPEDNRKVRPVWVYPAEVTLLENMFTKPYYDFIKQEVDTVMFGNGTFERLNERLTSPLEGDKEVSVDWSRFDKTMPNFIIDEAFTIVRNSFSDELKDWEDLNGNTYHYKTENLERVFYWLKKYFIYTRVMLPDGSILKKSHGIPSGSMFTQLIGSICNYLLIKFLSYMTETPITKLLVLGDDSSFRTTKVFPKMWANLAAQYTGMKINWDKVKIFDDDSPVRSFLGYSFHGKRLTRPCEEWFKRLLYSERDVQNLTVSASRVLGLLLIGGCNDDVFCKFAKFYFSCYPQIVGRKFVLSPGIKRMLRYSMHGRIEVDTIPHFEDINWLAIPTFLIDKLSVFSDSGTFIPF